MEDSGFLLEDLPVCTRCTRAHDLELIGVDEVSSAISQSLLHVKEK